MKLGQKEIKTVKFEGKKNIRKFNVGTMACAERGKKIDRGPDLKWSKGWGAFRVLLHPAKLLTWKNERSEELYAPKKQQ